MATKRLLEKLQELLMDELDEDEVEEPASLAQDSLLREIPQEIFELINAAYVAAQDAESRYTTQIPQLEAQKATLWERMSEAKKILGEQVTRAREECDVPDEPGWTLNFPDEHNAFPNFSKTEEEE